MSSHELENKRMPGPAADRILSLLKIGGPQTAADLGTTLGVTAEAARQQLVKMAADGLVVAHAISHGVGRPSQRWSLTAAGNARFPDRHSELTLQLIRTVRTELGEPTLDRLIDARSAEARVNYIAALEGSANLSERVARLVAIRSREGYMAEWQAEDVGYLLIENHCPICAAATECQGFCRSELELFSQALGADVSVERTEHIVAGARRCVYRIRPRVGAGAGELDRLKSETASPAGAVAPLPRPASQRRRGDFRGSTSS
jgi:predicted ArsR family transcriptional regulator